MASIASIEIVGLKKLNQRLIALPDKLEGRVIRGALLSAAKLIKEDAQQRVPEDTGFLRKQIIMYPVKKSEHRYADQVRVGVRKRARKAKKGGVTAYLGSDGVWRVAKYNSEDVRKRVYRGKTYYSTAYYWRFVEFGTSKKDKRPFLRPAFEAKKQEAALRMKQRLWEALEKIANKK